MFVCLRNLLAAKMFVIQTRNYTPKMRKLGIIHHMWQGGKNEEGVTQNSRKFEGGGGHGSV